jgi:hypothetical protein
MSTNEQAELLDLLQSLNTATLAVRLLLVELDNL